ncbi:MAG: glycosyltransferase family 4 protein [Schleiferiaceae bacterium]|jgi:glycosyltransferase involved in cell wall biosynthesis|nr:glycosyltransferase family 4 protein [Schleiferiaceae bacterium]
MKIGIEAQRIFREKKHGMDFVALELVKNLPKVEGTEYFIFVNAKLSEVNFGLREDIQIVAKKLPYPLWEQIWLPIQSKKLNINVLHCTANTFPIVSPCKVFLTLHDIIFIETNPLKNGDYSAYQKLGNLYRRILVKYFLKNVDHIITVSDFELNNIKARFQRLSETITINRIYNGVGEHFESSTLTVEEKNRIEEKYGVKQDFVVFLGNTDPKKNTKNTLNAFVEFAKNNVEARLVVGDLAGNFLNNCLPADLEEGIRSRIIPLGYIENKDLPILLKMSRAFLYPSQRESFGIPLLEGMSCGVPVITSNTSSMPEIAQEAAILVDPNNKNEIANALEQVWNNKSLVETLISKGKQRGASFSWSKMAKQYATLYTQLT